MRIAMKWREVSDEQADNTLDMLRSKSAGYGDTKISDYAFSPGQACTGLYFFFDGAELQYVGMSSSRAFIERVPSHLDFRPGSWFGTLLQKLARPNENPDQDCLNRALAFNVALLAISPDEGVKLSHLETQLRRLWQPSLNKAKPTDISKKILMRDLARY